MKKRENIKKNMQNTNKNLKNNKQGLYFILILLILLVYFHLISYRRDHPDATTQLNEQQLV